MASVLQPARALLTDWTLSRYLATRPPSHVVTVSADDTTGAALSSLRRHRILSAPVTDQASGGDIVGIFSIADAVTAFLLGIYPGLLRGGGSADIASRMDELASAGVEFCETKLRTIRYSGDGKLLYKTRTSATLFELVTAGFLAPSTSTAGEHLPVVHHRIAVWDLDGHDAMGDDAMRVVAVVSQSDVLRFLHRHASELGSLASSTLEELGLAAKPVLTATAATPALQVFAAMARSRVSSAGITTSEGDALVANMSASDLRGLTSEQWGALALPVSEFLLRQNSVPVTEAEVPTSKAFVGNASEGELRAVVPLVTVQPTTTFERALELFNTRSLHHLWVVDADDKPVGVITPTDVLRLLVT